MFNINRLFLNKVPAKVKEETMNHVVTFIKKYTTPLKIIFFGSILTPHFDEASDIDCVVIFEDLKQADQARRILYGNVRPTDFNMPVEFICVDQDTYKTKSRQGGIYFTAENEGLIVS